MFWFWEFSYRDQGGLDAVLRFEVGEELFDMGRIFSRQQAGEVINVGAGRLGIAALGRGGQHGKYDYYGEYNN
jgi:hypothetical protein